MTHSAQQPARIYLGTAGWSIPKDYRHQFAESGSLLERYAQRFSAVEINSSFYRSHRPGTYARWADSVPEHFRFAVKVPRAITHHKRLKDPAAELDQFLTDVKALSSKIGPLLAQLPPSLKYDPQVVEPFWRVFRQRYTGAIVCEPRHSSWFSAEADTILAQFEIARVAADPAVGAAAAEPGGWTGLVYYRLHGSPKKYYSSYAAEFLRDVARKLTQERNRNRLVWCIFDNTAGGAAFGNALDLRALLV